jgi:hypothetical protein
MCERTEVELFAHFSQFYCEKCKQFKEYQSEYLDNVENPYLEDAMALGDDPEWDDWDDSWYDYR